MAFLSHLMANPGGYPVQKLHLGCFDQVLPEWHNTDITPHIFVARIPGLAALLHWCGLISRGRCEQHRKRLFLNVHCLNAANKFPYADDTLECIYTLHFLEHLPFEKAARCLKECHRVLKQGSVLRIGVPDLDRMVAGYDPENPALFLQMLFEPGQKLIKNRHQWHYNEKSLRELLNDAGFREVYRCEFRIGRCPDVALVDSRPESLFMEGIK